MAAPLADLTACTKPLLALDSSGPQASVALVVDDVRIDERQLEAKALPSEGLIGCIHALLREHRLRVVDLAALAVGLGPGSYTGLRVGLASAKGLALGANVPLFGFSSLAMLAAAAAAHRPRDASALIVVVRDALRQSVYVGLYRLNKTGVVTALMPDALWPVTELVARLAEVTTEPVALVTGDAAPQVAPLLKSTWVPEAPSALLGLVQTSPALLSRDAPDLATLVPNYLRPSLSAPTAPKN